MNIILMNIVANYATFLDTSNGDVLNRGIAITQRQRLKAILRRLTTDERTAFAQYVRDEISTEPISEAYSNRPKALRALVRDLEADDEPTMLPLFGPHDTQHQEAEVEGDHRFSAGGAVAMNPVLMAAVVEFSIFLNLNKAKGLDREIASELVGIPCDKTS